MIKVLYDSQIFNWQRFGGISNYFYELIKRPELDIEKRLSITVSNNDILKDKAVSNHNEFFPNLNFKYRQAIIIRLNQLKLFFDCKREYNLFHPTYYDPYFLKYLAGAPFVLTVHDMIHEIYQSSMPANDLTRENKKLLCKEAAHIIAVSSNTKSDLIKIYNIESSKISVIHLGHSFEIKKSPFIGNGRYILFVGQRSGYKNFDRLLIAFGALSKEFKSLELYCSGNEFDSREINSLKQYGLFGKVHHIYGKTSSEMQRLYMNAICLVFPSEYEGFGIPILEAMASRCPVVLSDIDCFREVAGDAGLYFDPLDPESMYNNLRLIIESKGLRHDLIEKGMERVKDFSWEKMSSEIAEVYRKVV